MLREDTPDDDVTDGRCGATPGTARRVESGRLAARVRVGVGSTPALGRHGGRHGDVDEREDT